MAGPVVEDEMAVDEQLTDDELTELALAATPDPPVRK